MYVRSLTSGPKFHGRKSSLATRPRNPSRSDSDEHEEEARDETPSSQVAGPGNVAKKTGSDSRRRYPSCVPHGHVGAGMRALVHRPLPSPFPPRCATQPHTRSSQTSPSLRNSTGLACTMFFAHERESAFIESKGESYKVWRRYDSRSHVVSLLFNPPPLTIIAILEFQTPLFTLPIFFPLPSFFLWSGRRRGEDIHFFAKMLDATRGVKGTITSCTRGGEGKGMFLVDLLIRIGRQEGKQRRVLARIRVRIFRVFYCLKPIHPEQGCSS